MKRFIPSAAIVAALTLQPLLAQQPAAPPACGGGQGRGNPPPPPVQAKPEELAKIKEKTEQIAALVKELGSCAERGPAEAVELDLSVVGDRRVGRASPLKAVDEFRFCRVVLTAVQPDMAEHPTM